MSSASLAEELLDQIILSILDDAHLEQEYTSYPTSLYHHVSSDLLALSQVNTVFRRICFPFLFCYVKCKTLGELEALEKECISQSAFTGFIRTLHVDIGQDIHDVPGLHGLITQLLPRLESLVWLALEQRLGDVCSPDSALLRAIDAHPTLETAAIPAPETFPQISVSLDKLMFDCVDEMTHVLAIQTRNIKVARLDLERYLIQHPSQAALVIPLEALLIVDLREILITEFAEVTTDFIDCFYAFVEHHPSLTMINVTRVNFFWERCCFIRPHISQFLQAFNAGALRNAISRLDLGLSPTESSSQTSFDQWEVTELSVTFAVISFQTGIISLSLLQLLTEASTMFPRVSSLKITFAHQRNSDPISADILAALISNFRNLRVLHLSGTQCLSWAPLEPEIDTQAENPFEKVAACIQSLAWRSFGAVPSLLKIFTKDLSRISGSYLSSDYTPQRDLSRAIVRMKMKNEWRLQGTMTLWGSLHGSVVL
ncbi:hypothetical protein C8J56DRAFT_1169612 [Mycena floridula]|nr:hypothetical protein C8J56DRAFT_1169612 [Mycena floridula]